ncbi:hypothetical protein GGX14DRAFT_698329 [Mycena pura]|uniref:Uncharacterized protein n=1 Tax=Mycena pura TaxID=153505 RepID=A0AAD6YF88_9AGAR|nr:hypothetical protein GGX14DRAFT_698329 [Mycena pura]
MFPSFSTAIRRASRRCVRQAQSDASISVVRPAYRGDGPQCCHCGWRGSHNATCPFYNPATCSCPHRMTAPYPRSCFDACLVLYVGAPPLCVPLDADDAKARPPLNPTSCINAATSSPHRRVAPTTVGAMAHRKKLQRFALELEQLCLGFFQTLTATHDSWSCGALALLSSFFRWSANALLLANGRMDELASSPAVSSHFAAAPSFPKHQDYSTAARASESYAGGPRPPRRTAHGWLARYACPDVLGGRRFTLDHHQ